MRTFNLKLAACFPACRQLSIGIAQLSEPLHPQVATLLANGKAWIVGDVADTGACMTRADVHWIQQKIG